LGCPLCICRGGEFKHEKLEILKTTRKFALW